MYYDTYKVIRVVLIANQFMWSSIHRDVIIYMCNTNIFKISYMHYMTTDNKQIKFGQNRISQMASGSHFVTVMQIWSHCVPYILITGGYSFLCHTYV